MNGRFPETIYWSSSEARAFAYVQQMHFTLLKLTSKSRLTWTQSFTESLAARKNKKSHFKTMIPFPIDYLSLVRKIAPIQQVIEEEYPFIIYSCC